MSQVPSEGSPRLLAAHEVSREENKGGRTLHADIHHVSTRE
jgi:hypothetical protein